MFWTDRYGYVSLANRRRYMQVNEYWLLKGATLERDQGDEWSLRVRPLARHEIDGEQAEQGSPRRLRGDQSYPSLHLGRGTKWLKPARPR
jgi:hypothetical protein